MLILYFNVNWFALMRYYVFSRTYHHNFLYFRVTNHYDFNFHNIIFIKKNKLFKGGESMQDNEKRFEEDIESHLINHEYRKLSMQGYDVSKVFI